MSSVLLEYLALGGFAVLLLSAAISDLRSYTIPNALSGAIVALYFLFLPAFVPLPALAGTVLLAVLPAVALFLAGCVAFHFGIMGGGDVKLLSASALWAGPAHLDELLLATALAGGVLAVAFLAVRAFVARRGRSHATILPYAVAIAIGGFTVIAARLTGTADV